MSDLADWPPMPPTPIELITRLAAMVALPFFVLAACWSVS